MDAPRLLLITDPAYADSVVVQAIRAVGHVAPPGLFAVALRDNRRTGKELAEWATFLRTVTREVGAGLVIHRDEALARAMGADGVHYPSDVVPSPSDLWTSAATHSDAEVLRAREHGVSAALVSPIFATPGKGRPRGLEALTSAARLAGDMAVLALGGVDGSRAESCRRAGARGVAMIRALLAADHPEAVAAEVVAAFRAP